MDAQSPMVYICKTVGAATLGELSAFKTTHPDGYQALREWAVAEMTIRGIPVKEG